LEEGRAFAAGPGWTALGCAADAGWAVAALDELLAALLAGLAGVLLTGLS
jgi:hypothetical protein